MTKYSNTEFRIVAWDKRNPLPTNPQKMALYVVKDGLKFEMYFTDSMGNYLNYELPTSIVEKTSDIIQKIQNSFFINVQSKNMLNF